MARTDPRNVARYWWDRHVPGLSLMRADFTSHDYPPHSHEALVVAVTEQGGSVVRSRGQVEEAHPATLFVFNPAEPHAGWMGLSNRWRYRSLYLAPDALDGVAQALGVAAVPYFTRNLFADADLIASFLALHRALEAGRDPLRERALLVDSFGRLFRRHGSGGQRIAAAPRDTAILRRVLGLMQARHGEPLRLDSLAAAAGLTEFQLIGLFKRTLGLTPHVCLTQIRLAASCRHLRRGAPPAETAALCGFYDQSALNRHFKRCYGITPRQFAQAARNFRQYGRRAAA
jgi:AraC-like DNA-binding protein